jgi:hypothetical protein
VRGTRDLVVVRTPYIAVYLVDDEAEIIEMSACFTARSSGHRLNHKEVAEQRGSTNAASALRESRFHRWPTAGTLERIQW